MPVSLFQEKREAFEAIVGHNAYYLLTALPDWAAKALLTPVLNDIAAKQLKHGLWRGKNKSKNSYEILAALSHANLLDEAGLRYSPLPSLLDSRDEYALLIKRLLGAPFTQDDRDALAALRREIAGMQDTDGSFGHTVTGTVIHLERLIAAGMSRDDPVILRGVQYLIMQRKPALRGMHTSDPYDLTVSDVFTSADRNAEFQAAMTYRPEWLPRRVCFHTMAVIPNAVCLTLLVRLGLEDNPGVSPALVSLYELYRKHGGLCATNIKKPYL